MESHKANHALFIAKFKQNKGPWKGAIDGWRVAAVDGVELFASKSRSCKDCLTRELTNGEKERFHRAVLMQKVGGDPRIIYDMEMLRKQDGSDKAEGETFDESLARRIDEKVA